MANSYTIKSIVTWLSCTADMQCYEGWYIVWFSGIQSSPDSKVHGANMGPIWGRQDTGGPHVGPMNFAIWADLCAAFILPQLNSGYCYMRMFDIETSLFPVTRPKKNCQFWPKWHVSKLLLNFGFPDGFKIMHRAWSSIGEVPFCFFMSCVKF